MAIKQLKKYLKFLITGPRFYLGGGGGSSKTASFDPYATAGAQFQQNQNQANFDAQLNRYTQNNPFGTVGWNNSGTPNAPNWTQNTTLAPQQQQLYDAQLGTQNLAADAARGNFGNLNWELGHTSTRPDIGTFNTVKDALFQQLQPGLDHSRSMLETSLTNKGLAPGGEAYTNAMRDFGNQENNAYLAATTNAMGQMAQQQQMALAHDQQEIANQAALQRFAGNVNMPTYGGATTINGGAAPDIAGLINSQNNASQAGKNSGISSGLGALGSIGGSLIGKM